MGVLFLKSQQPWKVGTTNVYSPLLDYFYTIFHVSWCNAYTQRAWLNIHPLVIGDLNQYAKSNGFVSYVADSTGARLRWIEI